MYQYSREGYSDNHHLSVHNVLKAATAKYIQYVNKYNKTGIVANKTILTMTAGKIIITIICMCCGALSALVGGGNVT